MQAACASAAELQVASAGLGPEHRAPPASGPFSELQDGWGREVAQAQAQFVAGVQSAMRQLRACLPDGTVPSPGGVGSPFGGSRGPSPCLSVWGGEPGQGQQLAYTRSLSGLGLADLGVGLTGDLQQTEALAVRHGWAWHGKGWAWRWGL